MVVVWCCHQALCNTWWHPRHPSGHVLTTLPYNHHNTRAFWCQHTCHNQSTPIPTCVCVTVALSHPPCPQVWSSTTVCPASPPPGPSSTTNHHQQQQHKSKREWWHRWMRAWRHTRHTVWWKATQPTNTQALTQVATPTQANHQSTTHTGWMAKGLIARTCEESEKTTPCK